MKTKDLFTLILSFLILILTGPAYSWQGRMTGMGDPYGLVKDESDFLIHPAGIANGQGVRFYGDYRFNWGNVKNWNYTMNDVRGYWGYIPLTGSGDELKHASLLGAAFPMGLGRMGLFLQYVHKRGDYDGREDEWNNGISATHRYNLESDLDTFALRLLYGLPMGGFKIGGEIQLAYRQEENKTYFDKAPGGGIHDYWTNTILGSFLPYLNTFPFMFPYNSNYWESLLKGSLEGAIGPAKITFTGWGSIIFGGDNKLDFNCTRQASNSGSLNMNGDVKGMKTGGEFWLRYPLAQDLSLPVIIKAEYQETSRDGYGSSTGIFQQIGPANSDYKNEEKIFHLETGAGLDKEFTKGTSIAVGFYYGYIKNENNFVLNGSNSIISQIWDSSNYPDTTEHRITLRIAGEKELTPMFSIKMGLNLFYGWVKEDFKFTYADTSGSSLSDKFSLDGSHWGIGGSLGATVKFKRVSLEPFICGGYQKLDLGGDGINTWHPASQYDVEIKRGEWFIGGGASIKFDIY